MASEFPFVKLITPETMVGMSESAKVSALSKTFDQAYKSPLSVIVIDDLEGLLDWVDIGPRFSNGVLQALRVLLRRVPPKGRRLFVVATTNERAVLDQMKLAQFFDAQLYVPTITQLQEVDVVLQHVKGFSAADRAQALRQLRALDAGGSGGQKINVGIKKLLFICANARQDAAGMVDKFVNTLAGHTF
ncbi:MAG: hypothetical protein BJ554DRAFT_1286 [Olpidium bornovanus]|uniref:Vesicular-fusion protein SEC18 n=1 Tax=Olpidium bornovanus TaxID=278681 RepID=A0A8H7ZSQ6_9FUNG|nr:MAG: hypothetical protein BJ554DRAFT_1286 [Olpidium bornovanus]